MDNGLRFESELCVVVRDGFAVKVETDGCFGEVLGGCGLEVEFFGGDGEGEVEYFAVLLAVADIDLGRLRHLALFR